MKQTTIMCITNIICAVIAVAFLLISLACLGILFDIPLIFGDIAPSEPDDVTSGLEIITALISDGLYVIGYLFAIFLLIATIPVWVLLGGAAVTGIILRHTCKKLAEPERIRKRIFADSIVKTVCSGVLLIVWFIIFHEEAEYLLGGIFVLGGGILFPSIWNLTTSIPQKNT